MSIPPTPKNILSLLIAYSLVAIVVAGMFVLTVAIIRWPATLLMFAAGIIAARVAAPLWRSPRYILNYLSKLLEMTHA